MNDAYADTSGWANVVSRAEPFHALAAAIVNPIRASGRRFVTTNYVLAELVALLTSPMRITRPQQIRFLADLRSAAWVEVVHVDAALDAAAWNLWQSRPDKEWSLVDCASFVVMQQRGMTEALTSDHHFEQAGFVRLLK
jgi:predicted nucleic acid-binding protein